ncbi:MAG: mannose-6-phosphate isomerase, class I [Acidobacteriota bacterium]|jgi:mannose-6-phosphate isomerase
MVTGPFALENPIQNYAWGSRTAIAELLGRPSPGDQPEAELWIGAHPKAPSRVVPPPRLGTLDQAIEDDPVGLLGAEVCNHFGNELPFLLKILAAAEPLSIQAHPDQEQARAGWTRENAEGIPLDAARRNYRDLNHKPELICALTPFTALKGFRPADDLARRLEPIAGPELGSEVGRLGRERTTAALRALFTRLMTLEPEDKDAVLPRALAEAARQGGEDPAWEWVARLQARHPGDVGTLSPLYLNLVTLAPEEALFLSAGELHTYLEGTAIEIMANSDNVLRGGLTPKYVDVPELLGVLDFESQVPEIIRGQPTGPCQQVFRTPAREFALALLQVAAGTPFNPEPGRGVEILLGIEGECVLLTEDRDLPLGRGRAAFVPASVPSYEIGGTGRVVRASVPA